MYQHTMGNTSVQQSSLDIDAMLFDVSNRMARAQLARQISSSSSTFRQRVSRISKANSAGSSPQSIQRRKTTSSYKAPRQQTDMLHQGVQMPRQDMVHSSHRYQSSTNPIRPVSWHPSVAYNRGMTRMSNYEVPARHSTVYQTMAVNGLPTPMTQPDLSTEVPVDPHFSLDGSSPSYQQQIMACNGFDSAGLSFDPNYQPVNPYDSHNSMHYPSMAVSDSTPTCSAMAYPTQAWAESLATFPLHTAPPSPDFLPIQNPMDIWDGSRLNSAPSLPKKASKELVGMGLYDHPDRNSFSADSILDSYIGSFGTNPHHDSQGKGLKLEETWEPPEEDKDSDEEEEEEEEETQGEESPPAVEEQMLPGSFAEGEKQHEPFYPTYPDLSNQSFFFDSDDTYFDAIGYGHQTNLQMVSNIHGFPVPDPRWA